MNGSNTGEMTPEVTADGSTSTDATRRSDEEAMKEPRWSFENWIIIGLFFALTVLGVALSSGSIGPTVVDESAVSDGSVRVPLFVYLYASLGALGYIFTRLITELDAFVAWGDVERLVRMALRIPAAWILAAGIYLFIPLFQPEGSGLAGAHLAAGVAFLVGLYVNVAFKSLGGLAERLLGRSPERR